MSLEIQVPTLGESIVEATVGKWLKQKGDQVSSGEAVVELETDKVNVEVTADASGVLGEILKQEGENVGIGDVLGMIETDGAAAPSPEPETPASAPQQEQKDVVAEQEQEPLGAAAREEGATAEPLSTDGRDEPAPVSPVARRIAEEQGIDLRRVAGSGPGGRITKEDVAAYMESAGTAKPAPAQTQPQPAPAREQPQRPAAPAPQAARDGREERIRMTRRRQTIAQRLVEAQRTAAMLTTFNEIDMRAVMDLRKRRRDAFRERHGVNLGFMSFFTKATVGALKAFPFLNAEIQGDEIVVKHYYDIGIAVGVEEGLVVPVMRDADRKSFAELEREIGDLAKRAREGKLGLQDLQGGTFSITNGGVYGSLLSTPILNTPQVGILGMHKIEERPVALDGEIVIRPMMYVALSYDHRIVDGSTAVRFLVKVKELIEDPEELLLEG